MAVYCCCCFLVYVLVCMGMESNKYVLVSGLDAPVQETSKDLYWFG